MKRQLSPGPENAHDLSCPAAHSAFKNLNEHQRWILEKKYCDGQSFAMMRSETGLTIEDASFLFRGSLYDYGKRCVSGFCSSAGSNLADAVANYKRELRVDRRSTILNSEDPLTYESGCLLLGISEKSNSTAAKKAFNKLIKHYNPDLVAGRGEEAVARSVVHVKRFEEAHRIVKDRIAERARGAKPVGALAGVNYRPAPPTTLDDLFRLAATFCTPDDPGCFHLLFQEYADLPPWTEELP